MRSKTFISAGLAALLTLVCGCKETMDQKLEREAREFTAKNCPHDIDPYTTLDSATYRAGEKEYTYHFTVKGALDLDSLYSDEVVRELHDSYLTELKNNIEQKDLKDQGVTITRIYRSEQQNAHDASLHQGRVFSLMHDHRVLASDHQHSQRPGTRIRFPQAILLASAHKGTR